MGAPREVLELVERFSLHLDSYKSGAYNEAQVRREFLDPFFKLLGWDIDNRAGYAEAYKDVIHEDTLRSVAAQHLGTPDYCFRIGGTRKFFLEAKKPAIYIKEEITAAFQLRSYAWSGKLPLSVLSDFEEFAVYDCRIKPFRNDSASKARIFYCTFAEYAEKWDYLASIFSREAVLKGSFDKFAEANKAKRGTTEVDTAFLLEIENWRKELAENLALRNQNLTERQLNFAVQRIIDRIVFLRICEDRGTETYGRLQALVNGPRIYQRLAQLFQQADDRYNSGLFHFKAESGRHEAPDELTLELDLDDDLLRRIIKHLYYPESPYVFSFIPADILGQVYERFLGKVITLTAGHRARIEEKPEVRKAGGVYYTPSYIVDYIVRHTVGKLLDEALGNGSATVPVAVSGVPPETLPSASAPVIAPIPAAVRSPQTVLNKVAKLRMLDPACGSGSFLIAAYQYLLDWHLRFYLVNTPEKFAKGKRPALVQTARGQWKLSIDERKRILLNNIYGVDIDSQAVEVTKLSLLLKVLEGETEQSLQPLFSIFHERALPDLGDNIKCGNSLIAPDFYQQPNLRALDDEQRYRLNVFDWHTEFPDIFKAGGFDAVIGNPPYGAFSGEAESIYFRSRYRSPANSLDSFLLFVERAYQVLRNAGFFGMIIPSGWVSTPSAKPLRSIFVENFRPLSFVSLPFDVFQAYIDTVVVTAQRLSPRIRDESDLVHLFVFPPRFKISSLADFAAFSKVAHYRDWLRNRHLEFLITCSRTESTIIEKVRQQPSMLEDFVLVKRGVETFVPETSKLGLVNPKPAFTGTLQRYDLRHGEKAFISYDAEIEASKPFEYFSSPRILLRQVLSRKLRLQGTFANETFLTNQSVQSLLLKSTGGDAPSLRFLLGILNSRLLSWFFISVNSVARRDDFPKIIIQQTREFPIPHVDPQQDRTRHEAMERLVSRILDLHKAVPVAKTPHERTSLERQIAATEQQIDALVYELYGLTAEEIAIVEGKTAAGADAWAASVSEAAESATPQEPPAPPTSGQVPNPDKAWADAAHFYCANEEAPPYPTKNDRDEKENTK